MFYFGNWYLVEIFFIYIVCFDWFLFFLVCDVYDYCVRIGLDNLIECDKKWVERWVF